MKSPSSVGGFRYYCYRGQLFLLWRKQLNLTSFCFEIVPLLLKTLVVEEYVKHEGENQGEHKANQSKDDDTL